MIDLNTLIIKLQQLQLQGAYTIKLDSPTFKDGIRTKSLMELVEESEVAE